MELKPCPFCGSDKVYTELADWTQEDYVQCSDCKARTGMYENNEEQAIEAWNRRSAAASEWKPVSEKPKEEMGAVLFTCEHLRCLCLGQFVKDLVGEMQCDPDDHEDCHGSEEITHWAEISLPNCSDNC